MPAALGHATAATLAAGGLTVVAVDRNEHALGDFPGSVRAEVADTTDPAVATRLIDRIAGEVGPPDVLVNTIGTFRLGDAVTTTPETLRLMIDVNLGPALWLSQAVAPHMQQQGSGIPCQRRTNHHDPVSPLTCLMASLGLSRKAERPPGHVPEIQGRYRDLTSLRVGPAACSDRRR